MTPSLPWKPDVVREGTPGHQRHAHTVEPADGSVASVLECQSDR
jgi:hypothetical protein